jgi:DNA-directed RNA polymerase II subunit RPB1
LKLANAHIFPTNYSIGVVQNELARAEKDVLMAVEQHIVTGQSNKPVMGVVQDALSGSFFLSRKNSMFTRDDMMQLMMQIEHSPIDLRNLPAPAVFKPVPMWTGKQVFSMIVPKNISLERDIRDLKANKLDKNKKEIDQSKYKWIEEIEDERLKQLTLDAV